MAGIYIHIPFCKQACIYCNFHFSTLLKNKVSLLEAIEKELELQKCYFPERGLDTLYFGGGTPSLLTGLEIGNLVARTHLVYHLKNKCEITLEANPDDLTIEKMKSLKTAGINRLSIGVQSFFDKDLQWMNRAHNATQALQCLENVRTAGFEDFSADLIFGIPGLTDTQWLQNIDQMIAFEPPHLSCYALTLEPQTPLNAAIKKKKIPPLDEEQAARQFEILMEKLTDAGYEQYEISNFSKPGRRARHNSSYWKGIPYLGIGPAAHSYRPGMRQWNVANNALYIKNIKNGRIPCEKEQLTAVMQFNEYIMTSLRTIEGCNGLYVKAHFGEEAYENLIKSSLPFIRSGKMQQRGPSFTLTRKGKLFADGIASALFQEEA